MPRHSIFVLLALATLATAQDRKQFQTTPHESSNAAMVEYRGVRQIQVLETINADDFILGTSLRAAIPLEFAHDSRGKPSTRLALLMTASGKSERELIDLIKAERAKNEQLRAASRQLSGLEKQREVRRSAALRVLIEVDRQKANSHSEQCAKLKAESVKYEQSRAMYASYQRLQALDNPSEIERAKLAVLHKSLSHLTAEEVEDFRLCMERMLRTNRDRVIASRCEQLYWSVKACCVEQSIPPLTPGQQTDDLRDQQEIRRLEASMKTLAKEIELGDLFSKDPEARAAQIVEWGAHSAQRNSYRFYNALNEQGNVGIAAVVSLSQSRLNIGVDGSSARLKLTGTDRLRISSPDIKSFSRVEPDFRESLSSLRNGGPGMIATASVSEPFIEMQVANGLKHASVGLVLDAGVEVDLREINTKTHFIHASGGGRFLFSDKLDRTSNRLLINGDPRRSCVEPVVISVPSTIKLADANILMISESNFAMNLDCRVMALMDSKPSVDLEVRSAGGKRVLIPVVRNGKALFATSTALIAKFDAVVRDAAK